MFQGGGQFGGGQSPGPATVRRESLYTPGTTDGYNLLWSMLQHPNTHLLIGISGQTNMWIKNADVAAQRVRCRGMYEASGLVARVVAVTNGDHYFAKWHSSFNPTAYRLYKRITGADTLLGSEAVSLSSGVAYDCALSANGTSLKAYRADNTTPKITATDSALASGHWGARGDDLHQCMSVLLQAELEAASSPSLRPVDFFETPVTEVEEVVQGIHGEERQRYFAPEWPGGVAPEATWSAVIKSGKDGKPVDYRAVVRLFEGATPKKYTDFRAAISGDAGCARLSRAQAIAGAKALDDALADDDFADKSAHEMAGWTP